MDAYRSLIADTVREREKIESTIDALTKAIETSTHSRNELVEARARLVEEENVLQNGFRRRYPSAVGTTDLEEEVASERDLNAEFDFVVETHDWSGLTRLDAVERAVRTLTAEKGFAKPAEIEALLEEHDRKVDTRDYIGAALAHLNKAQRVYSRARAEWVIGKRPTQTTTD